MRDKERDKACRLLGWDIGRYTTDDIRLRPAGVADDVMRLRAEATAA
jgi:very-short-patch-repair endonuclease